MPSSNSTLLIYNTVDRLLRGDFFHTISMQQIAEDLADYPSEWLTLGIGTTNWMGRNGEVIVDGTVSAARYLWADPDSNPAGDILNLVTHRPRETGKVPLFTPQYDVEDKKPNFPFLAVSVCDPASALTIQGENIEDIHAWLIEKLQADNWGLVGLHLTGDFTQVKTTDAYNIPMGGLNLSQGYVGEDHFRMGDYAAGQWAMSGLFAANPSLHPFISVPNLPLHLHGFEQDLMQGGHIVRAQAATLTATVYPLNDLRLMIHNLAKAMKPVKPIDS